MRIATVCFLVRGESIDEVMLGYKKVRFGAGKYAGMGGGVEAGESIAEAAVRELEEETGVKTLVDSLQSKGHITFLFPAKPAWNQIVYIFLATAWVGEPQETEEMRPMWFSVHDLPFDRMWQDAVHWLPHVLRGERINTRIVFADDNETVQDVHHTTTQSN